MQKRSEDTRNRILETANRLFSKNGYDATGVAQICQEAAISKGAFYHHFPSKQALFLAAMDNWLSGLDQGLNLTRQGTSDIPQALIEMAEMVGAIFQTADVSLSIFLEFWVQAHRDPVIWQSAIAPYRRYQAYFSGLVQEGINQGTLRHVDPHQASRVLVSLAVGILMQALFDSTSTDWQVEARESIRIMLEGLIKR